MAADITLPPQRRSPRLWFVFIFLALATVLAATGYWMLFSSFAIYDDEGYILLSAREYLIHGKLYEGVYSQYGPAFYVLLDMLQHLRGAAVDHTSARLLTLAFWLGAAGCCAFLVWRQTASRSLSLFTLAATFLFLYFITDEPFHPGSLIFFALAASLCVIFELIDAGNTAGAAALAGGAGAFLLLTKINVGVFFIAGVSGWAVLHAESDRIRSRARFWVIAILILLAIVLMKTLLREAWVQIYLLLFASGTAGLVITTKGDALIKPKHAGWFLAAGASVGLAILAAIWLRGTSLAGLLEGVLLGPLRHPGNYSYPVDWRPGSVPAALLALTVAALHPWIQRRFSDQLADRLIVTLRLLTAGALLTGIALLMNFRAMGAIFSYVAPLIWIWVIPLKGIESSSGARASRGLLAIILLLQFLHAYPVGGSQESWGTFLFIPLVALGLGDVRHWLALRGEASIFPRRWWPRLSAVIITVAVVKAGVTAFVARCTYVGNTALDLPGAARLHLPESQRTVYRILALNAAVHSDMLFSLPGMFSFNLWTDLPAPTRKNTTLWMTLLNDEEQRAIIQILERTPRAGLIVQETLIALMQTNHVPLRGLLWDYLQQNFRRSFSSEGFAFWVHNGKTIASLNIATISSQTGADSARPEHEIQLEFCLAHDGAPISAIEVRTGEKGNTTSKLLDGHNSEIIFTAITSSGQPLAQPAKASWPLMIKGLVRMLIRFEPSGQALSPASTVIYLKGSQGEGLGEIRIGE